MSDVDELAGDKIASIAAYFSGTLKKRVAVLGAFDTWPYMDFVSRVLAGNNYIVATSRWIYRKFGKRILRFDIREHPNYASPDDFLTTLLHRVISNCNCAVVNFSVSAAHLIETDWCYHKGIKTLGIAYVRSAFNPFETFCECLRIRTTPLGEYSECVPSTRRTAWQCIRESGFCPFIRQDISKNVIEYFFRSNQMKIVAVENLRILPYVIDAELPAIPASTDRIGTLETSILKRHESIFRKLPISVVLLVNRLLQGDMFDRASKLKLLVLAETIRGVDTKKLRQSDALKSTKYMKTLNKGYVDLSVIAETFQEKPIDQCVDELLRINFLKQRELEYGLAQRAQLIRLSKIGERFVDFLEKLPSVS